MKSYTDQLATTYGKYVKHCENLPTEQANKSRSPLNSLTFSLKGKYFQIPFRTLMFVKEQDEESFLKNYPEQRDSVEDLENYKQFKEISNWIHLLCHLCYVLKREDVPLSLKQEYVKNSVGHSDSVTYWPLALRVEAVKVVEVLGMITQIISGTHQEWKNPLSLALSQNPNLPHEVFIRMAWDGRLNPHLFVNNLPLNETTWNFITTALANPYLSHTARKLIIQKIKHFYPEMEKENWLDSHVEHFGLNFKPTK